jgi:hypothetical protein
MIALAQVISDVEAKNENATLQRQRDRLAAAGQ